MTFMPLQKHIYDTITLSHRIAVLISLIPLIWYYRSSKLVEK